MSVRVALIVGSLREGSYSRAVALELKALAAPALEMEVVEIGDLPLYNPDLETDAPPAAWTRFRDAVAAVQAVLFVTPEYNRSVPGGLKNAIDVGSRPIGDPVWKGKPVAIVTVSPGALGGFGANHHLRQMIVFLDMPPMQQPEAYIGNAGDMFDEAGELKSDKTREFFSSIIEAFARHIARGPEV